MSKLTELFKGIDEECKESPERSIEIIDCYVDELMKAALEVAGEGEVE